MIKRQSIRSRLKHKLVLQKELRMPDNMGGYIKSWQDIGELWAEIKPIGGLEMLFAGKNRASVTHKIWLRYRPGVDASMRLVYEARVFNIRSVFNIDERNDMLEVLVEEGVAT